MNNDLISREALKKAIFEHCRSETENINHFLYDENLIALIDNAPTVEPERPQGEWKYLDNQIYCNLCNRTSFSESNFCSNCGAKMKGGAE